MLSTTLCIICALIQIIESTTTKLCEDKQECLTKYQGTSTFMKCEGDQACYNSPGIGVHTLYCNGNYACSRATYLRAYSGIVLCGGYNACSYADFITAYGTSAVDCYGALGCAYAKRIRQATGSIICSGYRSCTTSPSIEAPEVYCTGEKSCNYANISSFGFDELTVYATGNDAMSHAAIVCDEDSTSCSVICYGSGCRDLTIVYPNSKDDITLQPKGCKANKNQGQDIGSDDIVIYCPTLISQSAYEASSGRAHDDITYLFEEVHEVHEAETLVTLSQLMNAKDMLLYGMMMVNGVMFASCMYQRCKKKEYMPL